MTPLVIEVDGRVLRLESDSVIRIGRAIEADVVLTAGSVSRQHAELRPVHGTWVLVDRGSQFGTFVDDGRRVTEQPIDRRVVVRCGPEAPGSVFVVTPADLASEELNSASVPLASPVSPAPSDDLLETPTMPPPPVGALGPASATSYEAPTSFPPPAPGAQPVGTPAGPPVVPPPSPPGGQPGNRPAPAVPAGPPTPPPGLDQTQVLAAQPDPVAGQGGPPQQRTGPDLLLVAEGREHRFRHPADITIGRRTDSTVVLTDAAASRMHGRVSAVPGGWTYTNLSNEGTFHDGRRITSRAFDERIQLRLGHPVAGPEVTLVPILSAVEEERRIARRRFGRRLAIVGIVAAVLVLIAGVVAGAVLLSGGDDDPTAGDDGTSQSPGDGDGATLEQLTTAELDLAKAATVRIFAESTLVDDPTQAVQYSGSGSIIRSDGLILTNAHVAAPESPGLAEQYGTADTPTNPDYLLISLTDGMTDTNSPPSFRARVVEADGFLDVAVIQVYADAEGNELAGEPDLPTVPLGTSGELRSGDDVTVLGFPAVARSQNTITVTTGVISTLLDDPDLGPRSELDTDARIAAGNSGGMAINNDAELIGIPTAILVDGPSQSGRIRAIDPVKDLIEQAEAEVG